MGCGQGFRRGSFPQYVAGAEQGHGAGEADSVAVARARISLSAVRQGVAGNAGHRAEEAQDGDFRERLFLASAQGLFPHDDAGDAPRILGVEVRAQRRARRAFPQGAPPPRLARDRRLGMSREGDFGASRAARARRRRSFPAPFHRALIRFRRRLRLFSARRNVCGFVVQTRAASATPRKL